MKSLIVSIILNIDKYEIKNKIKTDKNKSSILVFLPGIYEIDEIYNRLVSESANYKFDFIIYYIFYRLVIRVLHSQISIEEQAQNFRKAEYGWRKVILIYYIQII